MSELNKYSIPIQGLKGGTHQFDFQVDNHFFSQFESSPIKEGSFEVQLFFDKRPDMMVLDFAFTGKISTECDRCLAEFELPLQDKQQLLVKYGEEFSEEEAEVVYIIRGTPLFNVARYIYEYICLAMPMIKLCEAGGVECDPESLKYLEQQNDDPDENSIWEELKKFNNND
ncbi:MAG: DUF177 domain-containing protein [Bacteroidota bacterium]